MKRWSIVSAAFFGLAACSLPTAQEMYGKGPLPNRALVERSFAQYLQQVTPGYFFVAEDGSSTGYSYCSIGQCSGMEMRLAQDSCLQNSRGARCWIYARDRKVVWDETAPKPIAADAPARTRQSAVAASKTENPAGPASAPAQAKAEPRPSSAADAKNESTRINRPIAIRWEGYPTLIIGNVAIQAKEDRGEMSMTLPNSDGTCTGSYRGAGEGTWALACTNGLAASGTFQMRGAAIGTTGIGKDTKGRSIDFTIAGSQSS